MRLGLSAPQVAVVDDRVVRGVAWGNRHGAVTAWRRNGPFRAELPDAATGAPPDTIGRLRAVGAVLGQAATEAG